MSNEEKGSLLSPSESSFHFSEDSGDSVIEYIPRQKSSVSRVVFLLFSICLSISVTLNVYFGTRLSKAVDTGKSLYSGLPRDKTMTYHAHSDYWGKNDTLADELWDALDIDPVTIAVDDSWSEEKGLPETERFPWDNEKGLFYIKGLHDLHCLKMLRHAIVSLDRGHDASVQFGHLYHCLDGLRQTVICTADDTPMRSVPGVDHTLGDGQQFMCRDWNKMIQWAQQPDKEACWTMIDDYKPIKHKLERHAFCPKDSPYYETMSKYFEIHGHKQAFFTPEEVGLA